MILVLFGERATKLAEELGYKVLEIPIDLHKETLKQAHKDKAKKIVDDGKEIALTFFEEQVQKGLDYLKEDDNRTKVVETGKRIAKLAIKSVKEKKEKKKKGN